MNKKLYENCMSFLNIHLTNNERNHLNNAKVMAIYLSEGMPECMAIYLSEGISECMAIYLSEGMS